MTHDPKSLAEEIAWRTCCPDQKACPAPTRSMCSRWSYVAPAAEFLTALCAARPDVAAVIKGEAASEAEAERDELFNRLGRVTSELGLSMDCTASRIIEAIYEKVDDEREACASVELRVEVPEGADQWTPLDAWEEALTLAVTAFRDAIRARGAA